MNAGDAILIAVFAFVLVAAAIAGVVIFISMTGRWPFDVGGWKAPTVKEIRARPREPETPPRVDDTKVRAPATLPTASRPVQRNSRIRPGIAIDRDRRPLWQLRGWRQKGKKLEGAFRTPRLSLAGEIVLSNSTRPEFFIVNPPATILNGSHGSCFRRRRDGKYFVHFGLSNPDIDAGIVAVEKLIAAAVGANRS